MGYPPFKKIVPEDITINNYIYSVLATTPGDFCEGIKI
jgi:hypothetical protein